MKIFQKKFFKFQTIHIFLEKFREKISRNFFYKFKKIYTFQKIYGKIIDKKFQKNFYYGKLIDIFLEKFREKISRKIFYKFRQYIYFQKNSIKIFITEYQQVFFQKNSRKKFLENFFLFQKVHTFPQNFPKNQNTTSFWGYLDSPYFQTIYFHSWEFLKNSDFSRNFFKGQIFLEIKSNLLEFLKIFMKYLKDILQSHYNQHHSYLDKLYHQTTQGSNLQELASSSIRYHIP